MVRRILVRTATCVVSALACLAILELGARLFVPTEFSMGSTRILLATNRTIENHWDSNSDKLRDDIVIRSNSLGFRGAEPPTDFDAALTVIAVGGSTTECKFLTETTTWPDIVGPTLEPRFDRFWINNAGIDGHSTFGHAALLDQHLARVRPDVALFLVGINDLALDTARRQDDRRLAESAPSGVDSLAARSRLLSLWNRPKPVQGAHQRAAMRESILDYARAVDTPHVPLTDEDLPRLRAQAEAYRLRLEGLMTRARELGIEPILITQPAVYGFGIDPATGTDMGKLVVRDFTENLLARTGADKWRILSMYNEVTLDVAQRMEVFSIDLAAKLPKDSNLFYDYVHFSEQGAARVGEIVAAELEPYLRRRFASHLRD